MYNCVIIDDEAHAIEGLKEFISNIPEISVLQTYTSSIEALKAIAGFPSIDLILMDVDMPGISGIELSSAIRQYTDKLVFTTAHSKYGYEAFQAEANGYLLKPYSLSNFLTLMNKLFPNSSLRETVVDEDFFFAKSKEDNYSLVRINYQDIIAIESKLNYIRIHTLEKNILTYMSLGEMARRLEKRKNFIQFQRSFILNRTHISQISGNTIKMSNGLSISVGDYYKKDFNNFIEKYLLKVGRR
ncbi:two-component system response regulator [Pedobacter ginsenosidimutans]|uniref:Two-component system response regulator n=1 Tax=Pedobacter ginsenosidimutans TaxID=687842 RepID=A0A0T5VVD4_9SPHI|nr:LytTR family DNA-binding domain-containing protein [Pedobacter ginsenosidimutans]KRT17784.1 two-component system response regulator [Pedobacter ginsenosidimutans]